MNCYANKQTLWGWREEFRCRHSISCDRHNIYSKAEAWDAGEEILKLNKRTRSSILVKSFLFSCGCWTLAALSKDFKFCTFVASFFMSTAEWELPERHSQSPFDPLIEFLFVQAPQTLNCLTLSPLTMLSASDPRRRIILRLRFSWKLIGALWDVLMSKNPLGHVNEPFETHLMIMMKSENYWKSLTPSLKSINRKNP